MCRKLTWLVSLVLLLGLGHSASAATNPYPPDGAEDIESPVTLTWMVDKNTITNDVYFGTDEATVAAGDPNTFKGKLMVASYDPGELEPFTTYYWKVDEFTPTGMVPGPVWSFTTAIVCEAGWDVSNVRLNGGGTSLTVGPGDSVRLQYDFEVWNGSDVPGAIRQVLAGLVKGPWSQVIDDCAYNSIPAVCPSKTSGSFDDTFNAPTEPGTYQIVAAMDAQYTCDDAKNRFPEQVDQGWTEVVATITVELEPEFKATNPSPADGAIDVPIDVVLSWKAGFGAASHDVYFGTSNPPPFIGNQTASYCEPYYPYGLEPCTTYYWKINEVVPVMEGPPIIHEGDVWEFTTITGPVEATNPSPADGAIDVPIDVTLSWTAGFCAKLYTVYFGTNPAPGPAENKGKQPRDVTSYDPGGLEWGTTYYWRIEEEQEQEQVQLHSITNYSGYVWSFTTVGKPAVGDYGDAPDPSFPSRSSSGGPCHLDVTQEWIGGPDSVTSIELDAIEPDGDADDKRAWWWFPPFDSAGWFVTQVSYDTANSDPNYPRYLNVLVDLDNNDRWDSGIEWPVRNFKVPFEDLPQGVGTMHVRARLPELIEPNDLPDKWTRVTLSERIVPDGFGAWGVFERGETEDFEIKEDFQSKLDTPPTKFQVAFRHSPKASENPGIQWVDCACGYWGKEVPIYPDKVRPYRWKIWIPNQKPDPDRWYNARILIGKDQIVLFYLDGVLVYTSVNEITPVYDGQAAVEIGNRKSLYDNVLVAEPGLHVNQDPVFFKEDFSDDLSQWNLWDTHTPPDIETIDSDGTPPPCLFLDDNDYAVSKDTFIYVDESIEFSANIRQADDKQSACLHVSKSNFPGDDYFARIKVTGSSHPNPNTVYCELLYEDNGEEKLEESGPLPIPIQEVRQVLVRFVQNPNRWCHPNHSCPDFPCSGLSLDDCDLAHRLAAGTKGDVIAKLTHPDDDVWVKLLKPDAWGRLDPKFGLNFGSNVVDGYLCFPVIVDMPVSGQDSVRVEVKTIYDPVGDYVLTYDYSESKPVAGL